MKIVMICGSFDPIHSGHLTHIREAKKYGDWLIAVTHPDEIIDKCKPDGCLLPLETRVALLRALGADEVFVSIDGDGKVAKTIRHLMPSYFVKDADRNSSNLPPEEIQACKDVGCEIVYLNNPKEASSSKIKSDFIKKALRRYKLL